MTPTDPQELDFDTDFTPSSEDWDSLMDNEPVPNYDDFVSPQDVVSEEEWMALYYQQVREDLLFTLIRDEQAL
jgi:hypothetical protein